MPKVRLVSSDTFTIEFAGALAGSSFNPLALKVEGASAPPAKGSGAFVAGNPAQTLANLQSAFATLMGTAASNIRVERDLAASNGERDVISFVGALDQTNIRDGMIAFNTPLDYELVQDGAAAVAEVQRVRVDRKFDAADPAKTTTGTFRLSVLRTGLNYLTAPIAFGASAQTVQDALRAAAPAGSTQTLGGLGTIAVLADGVDAYRVQFGGSLAGVDIALMQVSAVSVDPQLPSGTFRISVPDAQGVDQLTDPIPYTSDRVQLRTNIQTGLAKIFGAGNFTVVLDAAESTGRNLAYNVSFQGSLARVDVPNITSYSANLQLGVVKPYNLTQGIAPAGEIQQVSLQSDADQVGFKLTLTHSGKSVQTDLLNSDMSRAEVEAILARAAAALNTAVGAGVAATLALVLWAGKRLHIGFGGSLKGVNVADVSVAPVAITSAASLSVFQPGKTIVTPAKPARTVVVDYTTGASDPTRATDLTVPTGPTTNSTLNIDGSLGDFMRVTGVLDINLFGFFQTKGNFGIEKKSGSVKLADEVKNSSGTVTKAASTVNVDLLTIGANNMTAFAGLNGGSANELGLKMTGVEFGLVLAT
ncbi:MAG: hypothetical protein ACKODG_13875, partial [Betaproteobacteria bacterium]